ncbi:MAG: desulfoferrodoxin [Treponema sp.]|nr:desulfoferrodoxin [Treponema sp.]
MDSKSFVSGVNCLFTNFCEERTRILELGGKEIMNLKLQFFICKKCGKLLIIVNDTKVPTVCCGEKMSELEPGTTEGATEKHIPIIQMTGNKVVVTVGEFFHPMEKEHYIMWIVLMTDKGIQKKFLCPTDLPSAQFLLLDDESVIGAYAYCNIHKLWKSS